MPTRDRSQTGDNQQTAAFVRSENCVTSRTQ